MIRLALDELSRENGHRGFEQLCRELAQARYQARLSNVSARSHVVPSPPRGSASVRISDPGGTDRIELACGAMS
jgi:hypothetical protein